LEGLRLVVRVSFTVDALEVEEVVGGRGLRVVNGSGGYYWFRVMDMVS
jgi:hypothetical protein